MAFDVIIGRAKKERERLGTKGAVFLGKQYVKMGQVTSLSNSIYLDVTQAHVVLVVGKRGSGKSYTMGVISEGVSDLPSEIKENLSVVLLDTMGIYWTMRYRNTTDEILLKEWGLEGKGLDIKIYTPTGYYKEYKEKGLPTDFPFSIRPNELDSVDWCLTFEIDQFSEMGVLIQKIISNLKEDGKNYSIDDIIKEITKEKGSQAHVKDAVSNLFISAKTWGLFDTKGTEIKDLVKGGQVTVLDMSAYATMAGGWGVKSLAIGLIAQKLFVERMIARKYEEYEDIHQAIHYFGEEKKKEQEFPMVWLVIDEAHEFLPAVGKTAATASLITILREGRQPGISLILATQQPGKIHSDVLTQADTVIAHRITAKIDVDALGTLMQSYMREGLVQQLDNLPGDKGSAIVFDDTNERMYPMKVRPRLTWHGGGAPSAIKEAKKGF
ncbi:ATP-binding protein [Candidatus Woesearchaeota archaeon]|nr:ATP-binding protein [Candidatus Woesearchaeota archaeon]